MLNVSYFRRHVLTELFQGQMFCIFHNNCLISFYLLNNNGIIILFEDLILLADQSSLPFNREGLMLGLQRHGILLVTVGSVHDINEPALPASSCTVVCVPIG